jgi:hypothetical protein
MLRGIREGGPDENVLASMHHWWEYDLEALLAKSTHPRPRIWVNILISRHGNLIVEWGPEGRETGQQGCDWKQWYRSGHYGAYRPSNELLFIRNVEFASFWFAKDYRQGSLPEFMRMRDPEEVAPLEQRVRQWERDHKRRHEAIDATLLQAIASLIKSLIDRLRKTFEVRMVAEIEVVWSGDLTSRRRTKPVTPGEERLVH